MSLRSWESNTANPAFPTTHLAVVEGLGPHGKAAQLDGLLETRGDVQLLQLLIRVPGQLEGAKLPTLLCQGVQGVTDRGGSRIT